MNIVQIGWHQEGPVGMPAQYNDVYGGPGGPAGGRSVYSSQIPNICLKLLQSMGVSLILCLKFMKSKVVLPQNASN